MALYGRRAQTALGAFDHFAQRSLEPQRRDGWCRLRIVTQDTVRAKLGNLLGLAALAVRVQTTYHGTDGQSTSTQHTTGNRAWAAVRRLVLLVVLVGALSLLTVVSRLAITLSVLVVAILALTLTCALALALVLVLVMAVGLVVTLVVVGVVYLCGTRRLGAGNADRGAAGGGAAVGR